MVKKVFVILGVCFVLGGCASPKYVIEQAEYSAWSKGEMHYRKKTILLNTQTGETWGLAYDKRHDTKDGYAWDRIETE